MWRNIVAIVVCATLRSALHNNMAVLVFHFLNGEYEYLMKTEGFITQVEHFFSPSFLLPFFFQHCLKLYCHNPAIILLLPRVPDCQTEPAECYRNKTGTIRQRIRRTAMPWLMTQTVWVPLVVLSVSLSFPPCVLDACELRVCSVLKPEQTAPFPLFLLERILAKMIASFSLC